MFKKFAKDTSGNVLILSALATPLLIGTIGVGMDVAEMYRAKTTFQAAADAAALSAAKTFAASGSESIAFAQGQRVFDANMGDLAGATAPTFTIDFGNGDCATDGVTVNAELDHKLYFGNFTAQFAQMFGESSYSNDMTMNASTTVNCGNDTVEIALVLDNSGSMGSNSKLSTLKSASNKLVHSLFSNMGNSPRPNPVQFSLVPFSSMVNVGPQYKNAWWMDPQGRSPIHHEHFNWSPTGKPAAYFSNGIWKTSDNQALSRIRLYDEMGITWKGCVEQRPYPHHVRDTPPSNSNPETLFVPSFAPDTPDDYSGQREQYSNGGDGKDYCIRWTWKRWKRRYECSKWKSGDRGAWNSQGIYANLYGGDYDNRGRYRWAGGGTTYGNIINEEKYQNNYLADSHNAPSNFDVLHPDNTGAGSDQHARQKWTWKYFDNPNPRDVNNNNSSLPSVVGLEGGPNNFCTVNQILPLSNKGSTVQSSINAMRAEGATNVQQGLAWGWRTLSSAQPFTGGRSKSVADNKKIIILMTDGNHTYYPIDYFYGNTYSKRNVSYYGSYGHQTSERMWAGYDGQANPSDTFSTYRKAMDEHLLETCNNVKSEGIRIYSVAFDVPNGSSVKTMLEQCASRDAANQPLYYDAANNAKLLKAFEDIAEKIAELTVTK